MYCKLFNIYTFILRSPIIKRCVIPNFLLLSKTLSVTSQLQTFPQKSVTLSACEKEHSEKEIQFVFFYLHCFSNHTKIWNKLNLSKFNNSSVDSNAESETKFSAVSDAGL